MSTAAASIPKTPLESWIAGKPGMRGAPLTRAVIAQHQLKSIRETVAWVRMQSAVYAQRLAEFPEGFPGSLEDVEHLPTTTAEDLAVNAPGFLCVSQSEVSRVVTLQTSGTCGPPKRIFFTAEDQELALDFFANGVTQVAAGRSRMLIALPGDREGSVGYQLAAGIARAGVVPIPHGLSVDPAATLARMEETRVTSIIGLPVQMLALAMTQSAVAKRVMRRLRSIVLCSDHVPTSLVLRLQQSSGVKVFEHYGMTEMGLGGGMNCEAHMGYHLRESDLFFEILDPQTSSPLPAGEVGEVVFTTLNRTAMPLIRYRTGDVSRFLPEPCKCGTILNRLERVRGRVDGAVRVGKDSCLNIAMLDEALFAVPGLLDFSARFIGGSSKRLEISVCATENSDFGLDATVADALRTIPAIRDGCARKELQVRVVVAEKPFRVTGAKRKIEVHDAQ